MLVGSVEIGSRGVGTVIEGHKYFTELDESVLDDPANAMTC